VVSGPGLTLEELVARTGTPVAYMRAALSSEISAGRIVRSADGRYSLVRSTFPPGVLAALRALSPPTTAALNGQRRPPARARLNRQERELLDRLSLLPVLGDGLAANRAGIGS
jgi:hypothetical protein